jgi:hypothetical protein
LDCELFGGSIVSSLIELFERSTLRSFEGEELIYCVRGRVLLEIRSEIVLLEPGDAASLWASCEHSCGPAEPVKVGQAPPMILSVRVEAPSSRRLAQA